MLNFRVLDEQKNVVDAADWMEACIFSANPHNTIVAKTVVGENEVSTCFSIVPVNLKEQQHFETMIFGRSARTWDRYKTYQEALDGHYEAVKSLDVQLDIA